MVYYTKTFQCCHELTPQGRETYQKMLEAEADMILFKHQHPFKWLWQQLKEKFNYD